MRFFTSYAHCQQIESQIINNYVGGNKPKGLKHDIQNRLKLDVPEGDWL